MAKLTDKELQERIRRAKAAGATPEQIRDSMTRLSRAGSLQRESVAPVSDAIERGLGGGGLGRFVSGITRPAESGIRSVGGAGVALAASIPALMGNERAQEFVRSGDLPGLTGRQEELLRRGKTSEVVKEGLRAGAGISTALPVGRVGAGGGAVRTLAPGILNSNARRLALLGAGTGGAAALSEDGSSLADVAAGTILGGAVGGTIGKAGDLASSRSVRKAVQKAISESPGHSNSSKILKPLSEEMRNSVDGIQDYVVKKGGNLENTVQRLRSISDDAGLSGSAVNRIKQADAAIETVENSFIEPALKKSKATANVDDVMTKLVENLEDSLLTRDVPSQESAFNNINKVLKNRASKDGVLTMADLLEARRIMTKNASRAYSKMERGIQPTAVEEIIVEANRAMNDIIENLAPEVRASTRYQSNLFEIKEALAARVGKGGIGVGNFRLPSRMSQAVVGGLESSGRAAGAAIGSAKVPATGLGPASTRAISTSLGSGTASPNLSEIIGGEEKTGLPTPETKESGVSVTLPDGTRIDKDGLFRLQVFAATTNNPLAQQLADVIEERFEKESGAMEKDDLTEKQTSFLGAGKLAEEALSILEGGDVQVGPVAGRISKLSEITGAESSDQTRLKSKIATARTAARNALLGANMSDKEIESYLDATFDIRLPTSVLTERIRTFVSDMQTLARPQARE